MANNCWNFASVTGPIDRMNQIENTIKSATNNLTEPLYNETFKKLFPEGTFEFNGDVYEDFGSKWFDVQLDRVSEDELHISGDSAWSPIIPLLNKISEHYKVDVHADYEEQGCNFGGFYEVKKGVVVRDECMSYIEYVDKADPGRAFEIMMDDTKEGIFSNFKDFEETYGKYFHLITGEQLSEIRREYESDN